MHRSPTSTLLCSPPTPSSASASATVVPCLRPTRGGGFFFAELPEGSVSRPRVPPRTRGASGRGHRVPVAPVVLVDRRGPPRSLGRPLHARRSPPPRWFAVSSPLMGAAMLPSGCSTPWASRIFTVFEALPRGSRVRVPTHRRLPRERQRKARYRPAG